MALHIPSHSAPMKPLPNHSSFDHGSPREWRSNHLSEAFDDMHAGKFGNLKDHQVAGIREIIEKAAGADGHLSPTQTRDAMHRLGEKRIDLGLDRHEAERIIDHFSGSSND